MLEWTTFELYEIDIGIELRDDVKVVDYICVWLLDCDIELSCIVVVIEDDYDMYLSLISIL